MQLVFTLILCIVLAFLFTSLARKLRFPSVVALIVLGLIIDSPLLKKAILEPNTAFILTLSDYGLICLMFLAGLEVSWTLMHREEKGAVIVALFAEVTPFLLGAAVFLALGFSLEVALIVGVSMSITAEATTARVLLGLKKLKTRLAALLLGAGIVDDVIGIALFSLIAYSFVSAIPLKDFLTLILGIAAFFMGILAHIIIRRTTHKILLLEKLLLYFVVPFFFIGMGIHFSMKSLILNLPLLLIVILVAIVGKIGGSLLTKPFTKLRWKQLYLVGWGMNSRGAVGLALAFIAFETGMLPVEIYSALIIMALVTTLTFPFVITSMIRKEPRIMR